MNKQELIKAFQDIGVKKGMTLEVHSSLSSFGHVEGGADAVIDALMECVGEEGSIFMPALRLSPELPLTEEDKRMGITVKIKVLPEDAPRTAMGLIADTFRMRHDVITSEGVIRTSGWGKHAQEAVNSGFGYAINNGGKALMLGVDIYKLTAMHYMEDALPEEIGKVFAPTAEVNEKYPPEEWFMEAGAPPVKPWYTIQDMAYEQGLIQDGYIGSCKYMFFDVQPVVYLYRQELEKDAFALYGLKR